MNSDNNSKIKVTVIVPVFNAEIYLRECLDSLINQTLKEIEIILIDDNSTDSSGIICYEYSKLDNRISVIQNKTNIRQGLSRNKGIKQAKGEFLGFVDADDYVDLDFFEKLYNSAIISNTDIAKTEAVIVNSDGSRDNQSEQNKKIKKGIKKGSPLFVSFGYEHWTAIYNRQKIIDNNVQYPDIRNGQDDIFLLRSTYFLNTISIISGTYYFYRQHSLSTISIREMPYFESILIGFRFKVDFLNSNEMRKSDYLASFYLALLVVNIRYSELIEIKKLDAYKPVYVREALSIMAMYKYDKYELLSNFSVGFGRREGPVNLLEKNSSYLVYNGITNVKNWLFNILK